MIHHSSDKTAVIWSRYGPQVVYYESISLVFCHDQGIGHLESWIVFLTTPLQTKLYCQIPVLVTTVESPYDINRVIRAYLLKSVS